MDGDERKPRLPAYPRPSATLFAWILRHGLVHLKNGVDAVVVDRDVVTHPEHVRDRNGALLVELGEFKDPLYEIGGIIGVRLPSGCLDGRNLIDVTVFLGELLDAIAVDIVPVGDVPGVEAVGATSRQMRVNSS